MLGDFNKKDWLDVLGISEERIPQVLILRGTRNLDHWLGVYRRRFDDVQQFKTPNMLIDHVFTGRLDGTKIAYASVYGGAMASEVAHLFGVLGTRFVVLTGNCGAFGDGILPGDLFVATSAYCGEGAAQYYVADAKFVEAKSDPRQLKSLQAVKAVNVHHGKIYTTAALFAETEQQIRGWYDDGFAAVDMETATVFAVANRFGMDCVSMLFVFDNPLHKDKGAGITATEAELDERRQVGNERCMELVFDVVREYRSAQ